MTARRLTDGEAALARGVFGDAIELAPVRLVARKWVFFQPRATVMAPCGCIHFHPRSGLWRDDFAVAPIDLQGLFVHEMVHVWQHQQGLCLPLRRHPFCRYGYTLKPDRPFARYGVEQQAEIVRHAFLLRRGFRADGSAPLAALESVMPFPS